MSVAVAAAGLARGYVINDFNRPLSDLWLEIIERPEKLASDYASLWEEQGFGTEVQFYKEIRAKFNAEPRPDLFLFLLARCVKAAVRYNAKGEFNQSPDPRRRGMIPTTMRRSLLSVSLLFQGRTEVLSKDYVEVCSRATPEDVIYMDPPYQGVCKERDQRYSSALSYARFVDSLKGMVDRGLSLVISYDGRTGDKIHGEPLPESLGMTLIELEAGRSSQATLLGKNEITIESLYLSPALVSRIKPIKKAA